MMILPPLPFLKAWREQGLSPQEVYQKCEEFYQTWKHKMLGRKPGQKPKHICPLTTDELSDLYSKHGLDTIGLLYGVSNSVVIRWLDEAGIGTRPKGRRPPEPKEKVSHVQPPPVSKEELAAAYAKHTLKEMGPIYGVSFETIRLWLKKLNIPRTRKRGKSRAGQLSLTKEKLLDLYSKHTLAEIAQTFKVGASTVAGWMAEAGVTDEEKREVSRPRRTSLPPVAKEELADLYSSHSLKEIARRYSVTPATVCNWMDKYGQARRPRGFGGPLKPIGCEKCKTEPRVRGYCKLCYHRWWRRNTRCPGEKQGNKIDSPTP